MPSSPDDVVETDFVFEHEFESAELLPLGRSDFPTVSQRHMLEQPRQRSGRHGKKKERKKSFKIWLQLESTKKVILSFMLSGLAGF